MRAIVKRASSVSGTVRVPGDKSISHRAVLFGAMARGVTRIEGLALGADVLSSLAVVERLGVQVERGDTFRLTSAGRDAWRGFSGELDCGNSGTTARLLMGILAPVEGLTATVTGDASLSKRPMKRVSEPLAKMGARVDLSEQGSLPATVHGSRLSGTSFELNVASAQVKTALLLAGLAAQGETWVKEPALSRDHTERMLPAFGVRLSRDGDRVGVTAQTLEGCELVVPGDPSSAAFFAAAAAVVPGAALRIEGAGTNPTRIGFVEAARSMGTRIDFEDEHTDAEPYATWACSTGSLSGTRVAGEIVPRLVDEVPVLAVMAACAQGVTEIRDASELRVKESDRIALMVNGLRAMGADIEELPDGMIVRGGRPLKGTRIDPHMDHRIAMAFAIAGLVADGETVIEGAEWADVSFPGFWDVLARVTDGAVRTE